MGLHGRVGGGEPGLGGQELGQVRLFPGRQALVDPPGRMADGELGRNAVASCEVAYDGLYVNASDRVGEEGRGFTYLLDGLNAERVLIASWSGATKRVRPSVRFAHSPTGVVRVSSRTRSDSSALDVQTLRPVIR